MAMNFLFVMLGGKINLVDNCLVAIQKRHSDVEWRLLSTRTGLLVAMRYFYGRKHQSQANLKQAVRQMRVPARLLRNCPD